MIYCDELPFVILSRCYYLNNETMNIIYFYSDEDDPFVLDWEEYIAETIIF